MNRPETTTGPLRGFDASKTWWVLLLMVLAVFLMKTASADTCATTPTYKHLEQIQALAYVNNPTALQFLRAMQQQPVGPATLTDELNKRPNAFGGRPTLDPSVNDWIKQHVISTKPPTCYESAGMYWMLTVYMSELRKARKALGLTVEHEPAYGSLPNTDLNAQTVPGFSGLYDEIMAFNYVLFMFAYQMSKVTITTIQVSNANDGSDMVSVDLSASGALQHINSDPTLKINFVNALLQFLQLEGPETEPIDQAYDAPTIYMTEGMELFAVAHEYSHVILHHEVVGTNVLNLSGRNIAPTQISVVAHSWSQELQADELAFKLMCKVYDSGDDHTHAYSLFQLYGPIFYFRCMEVVDAAKYIKEHGVAQSSPTPDEVAFVKAYIAGRSTVAERIKYARILTSSHPPTWYRIARLQSLIDKRAQKMRPSTDQQKIGKVATTMSFNLSLLWSSVEPKMPTLFDQLKTFQTNDRHAPK